MFTRPPFDSERSLTAWLERDAHVRPPDTLLERVLSRTAATRRRPGWLVIERWFPMDKTARFGAIPAIAILLAILSLLLVGLVGATVVGSQPGPGRIGPGAFLPGPPLNAARASHRATLLPDGRVLVTGGYDSSGSTITRATAELYDPATETFAKTEPLVAQRNFHSATLLDDGRVLVVGGQDSETGELFDPETGTFSVAGPLTDYRANHTATLLPDGRVLIVGGYDGPAEAEMWDPATATFGPAAALAQRRGHHTATLLPDGRVLIVGGPAMAELWDPATEAFGPAGRLHEARWWPTATLLPDGRVIIIGGFVGEAFDAGSERLGTAEVWDPTTLTFSPAGSLIEPRAHHTATLLPDGRILLVGGGGPDTPTDTAELWDPATGSFSQAASLAEARGGHSATLLPDGRVLVAGGYREGDLPLRSTEVWDPSGETLPSPGTSAGS